MTNDGRFKAVLRSAALSGETVITVTEDALLRMTLYNNVAGDGDLGVL